MSNFVGFLVFCEEKLPFGARVFVPCVSSLKKKARRFAESNVNTTGRFSLLMTVNLGVAMGAYRGEE